MRILTIIAALTLVATACGSRTDSEQVVSEGAGNDSAVAGQPADDSTGDAGGDGGTGESGDSGEATATGDDTSGGGTAQTTPQNQGNGQTPSSQVTNGGGTSGGGSASGSPSDARSSMPAGLYTYDTDGTSTVGASSSELPEKTTLEAKAPSGTTQVTIRDMRDDDGDGSVTELHLDYRTDGVYLLYLKLSTKAFGQTTVYEFEPSAAPRVADADPAPGDTTTFTMTSKDGGLTVETTVSIERQEQVTVAGSTIDTLVIRQHSQISGDAEGTSTIDQWIDAEGRTVKEQGESDLTFNGTIPVKSEQTSILQSLQPS